MAAQTLLLAATLKAENNGRVFQDAAIKFPDFLELEFNPQRKLPNAVPSGVTDASGLNLSECADAIVVSFGQIVAWIIPVWVVGEVGKAALELQLNPLCDLEILGEPEGEVDGSGANQRPHGSVAKATNDATVGEA